MIALSAPNILFLLLFMLPNYDRKILARPRESLEDIITGLGP